MSNEYRNPDANRDPLSGARRLGSHQPCRLTSASNAMP